MPGQRETEATRREQILKAAYKVALRREIDGLTGSGRPQRGHSGVVSLLIGFPVQAMINPGTLDPREYLAVIHGTPGRPGLAA